MSITPTRGKIEYKIRGVLKRKSNPQYEGLLKRSFFRFIIFIKFNKNDNSHADQEVNALRN